MTRAGRARSFLVASALIDTVVRGSAWAAPPTVPPSRLVLLARPDDADAVTGEALARVSGELIAAGFDVRTVRVAASADPRTTVETAGRDRSPAAAFAIFPGRPAVDGTPSAEIWVSDRLTGRATVEHLSMDPRDSDRRAAVLAVRAVELLKASVAELWVGDGEPARRSQPAARTTTAGESARPAATVIAPAPVVSRSPGPVPGVEAALAVVGHAGGFPVDVGPLLRVTLGLRPDLGIRLSAFGLDKGWNLSTSDGSARVRQQLATADVVAVFRAPHRLRPRLIAGLGASRLDVTGTGNPPWMDLGLSTTTWTAMAGAGAGATLALGPSFALVAEVDTQFFLHRPVVRIGNPVGQGGLPMVLGTIGLLVFI